MKAFQHKDTGEIKLPVPEGDHEKWLEDSDDWLEMSTAQLKDAIGEESFKQLPRGVREGTRPAQDERVPRIVVGPKAKESQSSGQGKPKQS